ncbi:homeodomain-like protein [Tanacetum coccineum]
MATPFANPKRQFWARRDTSPTPIHNIYTFMNLRCSTENAIEHIGNVLEVASLFNTDDSALLQVFPLTLIGEAKRWFDRTSPRHAKNWNELKQNFIQRFCPPAMILEQLGEIHNFKLKGQTLQIVASNGLIPGLTGSEALRSIQELTDHSHKWHNEECKNTPSPFNIIAEKLKALNHEMDELRVDVRKSNTNDEMRSLHEEIKSIRTSEISYNKFSPKSNIHSPNLKDTFEHYLKESCKRQDVLNE